MATKSILELEEARRRLQQMTDDHRQLAELVVKLKSMRDTLAKTLDDANAHRREAEKRAGRAQDLLDTTTKQLDDFRKESEATLADVFSTGVKVEARLKKLVVDTQGEVQALTGQVTTARAEMEKQFVALSNAQDRRFSELQQRFTTSEAELQRQLKTWNAEQERRFASFREQHEAALRAVKEAYDRAKAALESHSPLFDRLDAKVDKLIESQAESTAALRREMEDSRIHVGRKHDELAARCQAEIDSATKALTDQTASECQRIAKLQAEHERLLRRLRKRIRYGRLLLWLVLLAAAAVLGALVYYQRGEMLRFWGSIVHSLR